MIRDKWSRWHANLPPNPFFFPPLGPSHPNPILSILPPNPCIQYHQAEEYLIASGLPYILCPGGLLDKEDGRRVVFGVDDALLARRVRSIPLADVAACAVAALASSMPATRNRYVNICSEEPEPAAPEAPMDWRAFYTDNTGNCKY